MGIDAFIYKLLILSIPGSIAYMLYAKIAIFRREVKHLFGFQEVFFILITSLICSTIYDLLISVINFCFNKNLEYTLTKVLSIGLYKKEEVLWLIIIGICVGLIASIFETKKILYRIVRKLNISTHYGDDDVWTFVCNSPDIEWIYVRDHKYGLVYFGKLEQYSDPGEERELLLSEVSVYTNTEGKFCYETPKLYISRNADELTIENPVSIRSNITNEEKKDE